MKKLLFCDEKEACDDDEEAAMKKRRVMELLFCDEEATMKQLEAYEELDDMKKRFQEMEDEAAALRDMHANVEKEMDPVHDPAAGSTSQVNREEVDSRSVFVGNSAAYRVYNIFATLKNEDASKVDYSCTPEEVQRHFQSCGTVNRITIRTDKYGQPKGYAYVEFLEAEAVQQALLLNETELHGRQLKVTAKRTNIPGMKQYRPRRPTPFVANQSRALFIAPYIYSPYGYGKVPRVRMPMRYSPYF
ncbi:hypothetical protein JRO89_XS02G0156600 [Xanthoceras sorbifolium]|uniref:RRM domain-containing protein n=1 Tax=Xanthoceras sorbifolium TaxID=99658 RepID=A0ABQ8IFZ9_9ROSI|nr:hypothetical protein JRO89_XS02G0156600 [Xanthoceras sorbifolium]